MKSSTIPTRSGTTASTRSVRSSPPSCPKTGQPDFGTLTIAYIPDQHCFELKSLKLYLQQFRNHGAFYERVTNDILNDLVAVTQPRWMKLTAEFTPRGGIRTTVEAEYPDVSVPGSDR